MRTILAGLMLFVLSACRYVTEPTVVVYPTTLDVPEGLFVVDVGENYGFGVFARVVGKETVEASDSISVIVRNSSVVKIVGDWGSRYICGVEGYGLSAICITRGVDVQGLTAGRTFIVFHVGPRGVSDSLEIEVRNRKG